MKNLATLLFGFLAISNAAFAAVDESAAKKLAIQYATNDTADHYYGGEESIESMTSVMKNGERDLFRLIVSNFYSNLDSDAPIKKLVKEKKIYGPEDILNSGNYYLVKIDYVDCARVSNFLAVDTKTGEVLYLFALGTE